MKSFVSWSGGKDCMYALHRFLKNKGTEVTCLLNMCSANGERSRTHGLSRELIQWQAKAIHIPVVQQSIEYESYEYSFKKAITGLKEQKGIDSGVFGDIYLQEHRDWIERVCRETSITPVFPLWKMNAKELMHDFIADDFKTIVVAVHKEKLPVTFLGRQIDDAFLTDIGALSGVDPCGDNGEYHTFVFDGPLFDRAVPFLEKKRHENNKHWFLEIE